MTARQTGQALTGSQLVLVREWQAVCRPFSNAAWGSKVVPGGPTVLHDYRGSRGLTGRRGLTRPQQQSRVLGGPCHFKAFLLCTSRARVIHTPEHAL